jgi:hypothetical protein
VAKTVLARPMLYEQRGEIMRHLGLAVLAVAAAGSDVLLPPVTAGRSP